MNAFATLYNTVVTLFNILLRIRGRGTLSVQQAKFYVGSQRLDKDRFV